MAGCIRLLSRRKFHSSVVCSSRTNPVEDASENITVVHCSNFETCGDLIAGKLGPGDVLCGYIVNRVTEVSDLHLAAVELSHVKTGAHHLHVSRKDANNSFSVGFRTTPLNSTGVAHILEHTTLCGSKKFPVRDPFFKMLNRSLSTFMNAFTANDWTAYLFSTQNEKDLHNLSSVYLDCVFFPALREMDFKQEGWRLEHQDPHNRSSPIIFKGVVFNEMKGVFATPENVFSQALQNKLYPSHTYSNVSGGWPNDIVDLSWQDLKAFHTSHYHPSNGYFFTYGDMPIATHLEPIDQVISVFDRATPSLEVPLEPRWNQPRECTIHCMPDPMAADPLKQCTVSVAFLLSRITDPYESMVLSVLCNLLVSGPASPFYRALLESNIGVDFAPMTGYDDSTKESSFAVGLRGIGVEDVPKVKDIIWSTLRNVADEGFPSDRVAAALHQIELGLRHQRSNFGLTLITSLMSPWIHSGDPVAMLQVKKHLLRLKEDISSGSFLQEKVRQYFLNNKHHLTLVMTPEEQSDENAQSALHAKLKERISSLSEHDAVEVYEQGLSLLQEQNTNSNVDCLPTLVLSDVERQKKYTRADHSYAGNTFEGGVPVQYSDQPTNGLTYFKALSGLSLISEEHRIYVPLLCYVLTRMGAGDFDYKEFAQQCEIYTGGLHADPHVAAHHTLPNGYSQGVLLTTHCVDQNVLNMLSLWEDVFTSPRLQDTERLRTLINMFMSSAAMNIANYGHILAMLASADGLSPALSLDEKFNGMTQVQFLKSLAERKDVDETMHVLSSLAAEVFDTGSLRCAVNCGQENMSVVTTAMEGFVDSLPRSAVESLNHTEDPEFTPSYKNVFYRMPYPVNYTGQSLKTVPYCNEDAPKLQVLAKLMGSKYLHKQIREIGGAYGSGAQHKNGCFSFMSYRDPNATETFNAFNDCIEWAAKGEFNDTDIEEAKLALFSMIDAPIAPGSRGSTLFLKGLSDTMQQQYRDRIFEVDKEQLIAVCEKYLLHNKFKNSVVIGPGDSLITSDRTWKIVDFSNDV